jgi:hypothetical protein
MQVPSGCTVACGGLRRLRQRDRQSGGQHAEQTPQAVPERFHDRSSVRLRRSDENADGQHDDAAEHDLEHRLQEWRVHIARANIGDGP